MPKKGCDICGKILYVKPSHLKLGWGKYCSKTCQYQGQRTGRTLLCYICEKPIYRNAKDQLQSKSGNFFCSKSCQTIWRNEQYRGEKHINWTGGKASYRAILLRSKQKQECSKCRIYDTRVLAVHHKDKNRWNNSLSNLIWLCHNCHYLVHHDKKEAVGFVVPVA